MRLKSAFVFVHGYNVTFEDAARRTAQMAYDLGFDGAPVFYSWPSQGETADYMVDEQNSDWTEKHLEAFLKEFVEHSKAENIYLVAHSMGNRSLTRAFMTLVQADPHLRDRVKELISTAPDIDADVFKQEIAPVLGASGGAYDAVRLLGRFGASRIKAGAWCPASRGIRDGSGDRSGC